VNDNQKMNIKSWSEEDRPREKLLLKGKESLSDAELIAILIGSGNREMTAVALSQKILMDTKNNLHELGKVEVMELMVYKGIGEAKAISIVAAMEIGRRRAISDPIEKPKVDSSQAAYNLIAPLIADNNHEEFWIILLNRNLRLIKKIKLSSGGTSATVVDIKILLRHAIQSLASSIILVHNHPSGNLSPSREDVAITKKIKESAKLMDISVSDHLIISQLGYYSFNDDGML